MLLIGTTWKVLRKRPADQREIIAVITERDLVRVSDNKHESKRA